MRNVLTLSLFLIAGLSVTACQKKSDRSVPAPSAACPEAPSIKEMALMSEQLKVSNEASVALLARSEELDRQLKSEKSLRQAAENDLKTERSRRAAQTPIAAATVTAAPPMDRARAERDLARLGQEVAELKKKAEANDAYIADLEAILLKPKQ